MAGGSNFPYISEFQEVTLGGTKPWRHKTGRLFQAGETVGHALSACSADWITCRSYSEQILECPMRIRHFLIGSPLALVSHIMQLIFLKIHLCYNLLKNPLSWRGEKPRRFMPKAKAKG